MPPQVGLYLDREEWEALPQKLEDPFFARLHRNNLSALADLQRHGIPGSPCDIPIRLDQPEERRSSHRALKNRLLRLVAAWYCTRDSSYLGQAEEVLQYAVLHPTLWLPEPDNDYAIRGADLRTGEMMHLVSFTCDALHPYLPPELHRRSLEAVRDIGLQAYLRGWDSGDWWCRCNFNWNSALHGNAGVAALALRHLDPDFSNLVLARALEGLRFLFRGFHQDGGWTEGFMYSDTALAHLSDFAIAYYRLSGHDLGLSSFTPFHLTLDWQRYLLAPDGRPFNFSNCNEFTEERGEAQIFWWADRLNRPDWAGLQERLLRSSRYSSGLFFDVEAFWFRRAFQPATNPAPERLRHFESLDWLFWRGDRTWLAFRSGFNGGNHNNLDLGHFILGREGERFFCDPGYGASQTHQHNAVTLRRHSQTDCTSARITELHPRPDGGFSLCCDLTACFPGLVRHFHRHLIMIGEEHLLVVDEIQGRRQRLGATWHWQTRQPISVDGHRFAIAPPHGPQVIPLTDTTHLRILDWRHDGPLKTISWRNAYDRVNCCHATLITFGHPEFSAEVAEGWLQIQIGEERFRFASPPPFGDTPSFGER